MMQEVGSTVGCPQRRLARIAEGRYVPRMSFALSRKDREAFLAGTHVAVVSVTEAGRGPLTVPVWYRYQPGGEVRIITSGATRKIGLLRAAGRMSLCVQDEAPPFRYVSVEGPVTIEKPGSDADVREMAHRYAGKPAGDRYLDLTKDERAHEVVICLRPERWYSADFSSMFPA
jgi:PPOX class probable F420-dependent enzyme